jgi:hypothetical protein
MILRLGGASNLTPNPFPKGKGNNNRVNFDVNVCKRGGRGSMLVSPLPIPL